MKTKNYTHDNVRILFLPNLGLTAYQINQSNQNPAGATLSKTQIEDRKVYAAPKEFDHTENAISILHVASDRRTYFLNEHSNRIQPIDLEDQNSRNSHQY